MKKIGIVPVLILLLFHPASAQLAGDSAAGTVPTEYTLADLFTIALERSEKIKISEEDVVIAERKKDKARSALVPRVSAFWDYTRYSDEKEISSSFGRFSIQPERSTMWGLRLDQSLSLGGREITSYRISRKGIEQSALDFATVREEYLLGISLRYFNVLKAQKAVEIANANVERLQKYRDDAEIKLRIGETTKTLLLRAEAELSGSKADLVKAENLLKFTKASLARFVGLGEDSQIRESDLHWISQLERKDLESLQNIAFLKRAEMKAGAVQRSIAEDQVKFAKGAYWPTLILEGVYVRMDEEPSSPFFNEESIYGALRLDFPFFEGGLRKAEVRETEAKKRQAELALSDLKKTIRLEVEEAYLNLKTQAGVLQSLKDQFTFARENFYMVEKQFQYGLASSLDVLDANTLLVTSELDLFRSQYDYQFALLQLQRATGSLLETVTRRIESEIFKE
jgi:outer membrane protein